MWGLYGESRATDECEAFGGWARTECKAESSCISQECGERRYKLACRSLLFMWGLYGESRATDECEAFGG